MTTPGVPERVVWALSEAAPVGFAALGRDWSAQRVERRHTPYRNAQAGRAALGNARLLTLNGWDHPSYQMPSKCIDQARARYLLNLVTPPRGTFGEPDEVPFS
jgi:hypothetical protein